MTSDLVSIMVPVHNMADYIDECLWSIRRQTYTDFEVVVVENHSADDSREIIDTHVAEDERIRVVTPEALLPQALNFNFGMAQLSQHSRFTKVVLADDWLFPRCLQEMTALGAEYPSIGLISAYRFLGERGIAHGIPLSTRFYEGREAARKLIRDSIFMIGTSNTVMYRSDLVRARGERFFPERGPFFDNDVALELLKVADFGFVHQLLTFSREWDGALTDQMSLYKFWYVLQVFMTEKYGEWAFSPQELATVRGDADRELYKALGRQWIRDRLGRKVDGFWEYNGDVLGLVDRRIERGPLARAIAGAALTPLTDLVGPARRALG